MKPAFFLTSSLLILCILGSIFGFINKDPSFGISCTLAGFFPLLAIIFIITARDKKERLLTEYDLEDQTIYGVVGKYQQGEPVMLQDVVKDKSLGVYQLTHIPAPVFRGMDAKNFSQMKKAIE